MEAVALKAHRGAAGAGRSRRGGATGAYPAEAGPGDGREFKASEDRSEAERGGCDRRLTITAVINMYHIYIARTCMPACAMQGAPLLGSSTGRYRTVSDSLRRYRTV